MTAATTVAYCPRAMALLNEMGGIKDGSGIEDSMALFVHIQRGEDITYWQERTMRARHGLLKDTRSKCPACAAVVENGGPGEQGGAYEVSCRECDAAICSACAALYDEDPPAKATCRACVVASAAPALLAAAKNALLRLDREDAQDLAAGRMVPHQNVLGNVNDQLRVAIGRAERRER